MGKFQGKKRTGFWASLLIVLMFLVPPWQWTVQGHVSGDVFYDTIIPGPRPPHCAANATCGVKIAMGRLALQIGVVLLIGGAAALRRRR